MDDQAELYPRAPSSGASLNSSLPQSNVRQNEYSCPDPTCFSRTVFKRAADLERHFKLYHAPEEQKLTFPCFYSRCGRQKKPFSRKDHLRDHLRDYHKEDIGSAKKSMMRKGTELDWQQAQATWLAERRIYSTNWTCGKCLIRMNVSEDGWNCTSCKARCEEDRIKARLNLREAKSSTLVTGDEAIVNSFSDYSSNGCDACRSTQGWVEVEQDGQWVICPNCAVSEAWKD